MEARRNTRKIAVQAVFQFFFSKEDINKILEEFCNYRIKEFKNHKNNGKFLEYARVHDYFYGTSKESIFNNMQNGYSVILDIDVQGARSIRDMVRDISDDIIKDGFMDIFIMPPSIKVLEMRLRNRKTNSEESIKKRLIEAKNEIKKSNDFNHVIINDNLESAFSELCNIIDSF